MLTIIAAKLLLNGAIKQFIVKPILNATMTVIPQTSVVQATLLNHNILVSTGDLIKFGAEALYDQFIGRKLDFQIEKISKYIYGVSPADEWAALFSKQYIEDEELIIDLTKFEDYLDSITINIDRKLGVSASTEDEVDDVLNKILQDLDLAINLSKENTFGDIQDEQQLIDQIIKKNEKLLDPQHTKVLSDFPDVPNNQLSDKEEIEKILASFV